MAGPTAAKDGLKPWARYWSVVVIVLAGVVSYHHSLSAPFVFDDLPAIQENPTIRNLRDVARVLRADTGNGASVVGRPLVNLSLAVNYALGGTAVRGYHVFNLGLHLLNAFLLLAIVRRALAGRAGADAIALATALLWTVHPLQTETVTCVVQRTESLMALFYLATLYFFLRGTGEARPLRWYMLSVAACLAGMATKEVMVTAPLLLLAYDRTFLAGSLAAAWRQRRALYLALFGTWLLLLPLALGTGGRGGTVGFGFGVPAWDYALTQCRAVVTYLKLSVWPHPLVFDYGTELDRSLAAVWPQAVLLVTLGAVGAVALWKRKAGGWLGVSFFLVLAPSSSVLPLTSQTMAEHRMYLPLAAVIALGVLALHRLAGRRAVVIGWIIAAAFCWMTVQRNEAYRSGLRLWADTVRKCPGNVRAHSNYGKALIEAGFEERGLAQYQEGLRLDPNNGLLRFNWANAMARARRLPEAVESYEVVIRYHPEFAEAHLRLGEVLERLGRFAEATSELRAALHRDPGLTEAHEELGNVLVATGRIPEAVGEYEMALRETPKSARLHYNLGNALAAEGALERAVREFEAAVRERPDYVSANANLANALFELGRTDEAIGFFEKALRLAPDAADIHANFGTALLHLGRLDGAREQFEAALRIDPKNEGAGDGLRQLAGATAVSGPGR